jgi:hypothetical protein
MSFALDDQIAVQPGTVAWQRLTVELARLRGTDPDNPHGGVEPHRSVMTALEL